MVEAASLTQYNNFYIDEPCVVSFCNFEVGWFLQSFQGYLRYLKLEVYKDHKFIIFMNPNLHAFVSDFIHCTLDLPDWFKDLNLEADCYEAPSRNSDAFYTDPKVYSKLIKTMRTFYNVDKAIEVFPPRGITDVVTKGPQVFHRYKFDITNHELFKRVNNNIIVVFPRHRERASNRNIPEYVWLEFVEALRHNFTVVLAGTPNGACLVDFEEDNIINLINYNEDDKTECVIGFLNKALCCVSSQSGGTHIGLLCECPSYIIGHEKTRHSVDANRLDAPVSFRYLKDYRAIDASTMMQDLQGFLQLLHTSGYYNDKNEMDVNQINTILQNDKTRLEKLLRERNI